MADSTISMSPLPRQSPQDIDAYHYDVEDQYPDVTDTLDPWGKFLKARIRHRRDLYLAADISEQELIRKEIQRIKYFRQHFKDYRVHASDQLPLVALLNESRKRWRDVAIRRAEDDLNQIKAAERNGVGRSRIREKKIVNMVKRWPSDKYKRWQHQMSPDEYMEGLDAAPSANMETTFLEDDPTKPDYGYNGWILQWDRDHGWTNSDNPLVRGKFPHQKISIQQFLQNKDKTPLRRRVGKDQLRYFHLPANNMKWVEEAMMRYYGEDNVEFDQKRVLSLKANSQRLLRNELWRGQQRGGASLPAHARQVATRCSTVPSAPVMRSDHNYPGEASRGKDVVLFMPYLHWEVEKRLRRMRQFVQVAKDRKDAQDHLRRATTNQWRRGGALADVARDAHDQAHRSSDFELKRPMTGFESEDTERESRAGWRPHTPLAKYVWHVAKLYQIIDEAADGRLIKDHLYSDAPLHARRTLEQFYHWTAGDTAKRDKDQVVCRGTRNPNVDLDPEATSRILMVDQLWLWILDDMLPAIRQVLANTVISAFPRRWGRNKPDPSAVHRSIRDRFSSMPAEEISSIHDIALVVVDECSKVFFDGSKPLDERPDVVNIFSSTISNVAENKTIAYEGFGKDISRLSIETMENAERLLRKSLNINFEWNILGEASRIVDELGIMQDIFKQQLKAMESLDKLLRKNYGVVEAGSFSSPGGGAMAIDNLDPYRQKTLEMMARLMGDMEQRRDELASMKELQTETGKQVRELLDMKQQQANIIEAKAAIRRADESVTQGRSIVVFTVVTIFFLPLSFFTSIFSMNVIEFNTGGLLTLHDTLVYMSAISTAVIVVSLALAFSDWVRTVLSVGFGLIYVTIEDLLGWRHKKVAYSSAAIRNIRREKLEQLENRDRLRRLTEIDSRGDGSYKRGRLNGGPELRHRSTWDLRQLADGGGPLFARFRKKDKKKSLGAGTEPV